MSEALSQKEIDMLLNNLKNGDTDAIVDTPKKEVKLHDFARPTKINKDQLRSLEVIFGNYARILSSYLTGYLRSSTTIEILAAEQVTYNEFSSILTNPVILAITELSPLKGSTVLDLSANLGYAMIERILGGVGGSVKKVREFSELEKVLLEKILTQMLSFLPEVWANVTDIKPRIEKLETNAQFAQIISPNEMCALITMNVKIGSLEGLMNFCIPYLVIEPVIERLNTRTWFSAGDVNYCEESAVTLKERLSYAKLQVKAVIGKANILVSDFVNLQPGDILTLDTFTNSELSIYVGNRLKFTGKPGTSRGKNAVQITSIIESEG